MVLSNTDWMVYSDADWATVNIASGSGNRTVGITCSRNPASEERTATITIMCGGLTQTIVITQSGSIPDANEDVATNSVSAYPNPVVNSLFINSFDNSVRKVEIYSLFGTLVINQDKIEDKAIDVSTLPRGFYLVNIYTDNEVIVKKIVKK